MNGVHDIGGMHGLGAVTREVNEPVFHEQWEARALALTLAAGAWGRWTIDASRHARELIPGTEYLRMGYYEKWIAGLETLLVQTGLVTRSEMESLCVDVETPKLTPPLTGDRVDSVLALGRATERTISAMPRFSRGEMVRGRNLNPAGHTRLPRYARGRRGVITRHHGAHVFPDTNAHALGECPQHLYQVRFEACDLWGGPTADRSAVYLDLWDDYLEPV